MLTEAHRRALVHESAILPQVVESRGYKSVTADDPDLAPFAPAQRRSGLLVPGWTVTGKQVPGQLRPDNPRVIKRGGKEVTLKYESPTGSAAWLDVHPAVRDRVVGTSEPLVITEGAKKSDSAISRGILCAALLGVWGWRGRTVGNATSTIRDFDLIPLKDRLVVLAFDSDVVVKREVLRALQRFTGVLERYGARVRVLTWEGVHG